MITNDKEINTMEQNETEIYRFMQIREEIHQEIKKIEPCILSLQDAGKGFVAHFEVFQKLSQQVQEQIKAVAMEVSQDIAQVSLEQVSQTIDDLLKDKLKVLDQSVQKASRVLNEATGTKYRKLILCFALGFVLSGLIGFGGGVIYSKRNTYALPPDFIKMYALGLSVREASPVNKLGVNSEGKQQKEKPKGEN
jgi:preprotein translocase subunit Sss1